MQSKHDITQNHLSLHKLKNLLGTDLFLLEPKNITKEFDALIGDSSNKQSFGIVVPIKNKRGIIGKIYSLFNTAIAIKKLHARFKKTPTPLKYHAYGVYPDIEEPVTIYQLGAASENYANKLLLPAFKKGLNGRLRHLIFFIINIHPSTAGIILIIN